MPKRWDKIAEIILDNEVKSFVEVGTAWGQNIANILDLIGDYDIDIWCVDPYDSYDGYDNDANAVPDKIKSNKKKAMSTIFQDDRVRHIEEFSTKASESFQDETIGMAYVDANHAYKYAKEDFYAWYPKVRQGGFFSGHDYRKERPGVMQALDEFMEEFDLEFDYKNGQKSWIIVK